ncbi:tetraacyldisaccharide 4'-kinase [Roseixanthobacter glucoisosaccharinicivorans]|uniref:tetraacyldisaccharide 4'-kinase n=1 Tax=Roseixanthobacter glucoisosaccharinicivorans TaxID=3119923 RepID=UPI00372C28F0
MFARAPAFWSHPHTLPGRLLAPIGWIVGAITLRRMAKPGAELGVPVICIGNPTVGGAGKTPTALALLAQMKARGATPFALLRGHGGREAGPLLVDPARHDAAAVGDEALLLAQAAPTIVARDRVAGARLAVARGASHIVMDDGFQNPSLHKDAALLVVDGAAGLGNGHVLPAGPLRAPFPGQAARADGLLIIGAGAAGAAVAARAALQVNVLRGHLVADAGDAAALAGRRILAFAGIGRPGKFFQTLRDLGLDVAECRAFPDHHPYTPAELSALHRDARAGGLSLVTTAKDAARLEAPEFADVRAHVQILRVGLELEDAASTKAHGVKADGVKAREAEAETEEARGFAALITLAETRAARRLSPAGGGAD